MRAKSVKSKAGAIIAALGLIALTGFICLSMNPDTIKRDPAYYYGIGTGAKADAATLAAKQDVVAQALTGTREKEGLTGGTIVVTPEALKALNVPGIGTVGTEKVSGTVNAVVRIKIADWEKFLAKKEVAARAELLPRLKALQDKPAGSVSADLAEASAIIEKLRLTGIGDVLTENGPGTPLLASSVEAFCVKLAKGLTFAITPDSGFVADDNSFTVSVTLKDGSAAAGVPILAAWKAADADSPTLALTDDSGKATLKYPADAAFRDKLSHLNLSTNFSAAVSGSTALKALDASLATEWRYRHFSSVAKYFADEARVAAGTFAIGALPRDTKAVKKEAARQATVPAFAIQTTLVTNELYGVYLDQTKVAADDYPEYFDNPDYSAPDQPVVGVSYNDAVKFAAWLSKQLGVTYRLPTEAEWEVAARGGADAIYPWGDQLPSDGPRANYSDNGKFTAPSPVKSFENGKNAIGLYDMAGNVWQWTSSSIKEGSSGKVVKGGSWMDGPTDLRVSNRKELNPAKGYVDVGIRLVREVAN
jgi:formylglycine-generating enzyme required for sulfatase activity